MKKTITVLSALVAILASNAFAASLPNGSFRCNNGGILTLHRQSLTTYSASLQYSNGSASVLDMLDFQSTDSLVAVMYPDDEGVIGQAIVLRGGRAIQLNFNDRTRIVCSM